jgi:hypothetical protein
VPIYQLTAPNGKTYRIEGPAGATQEQVQAEVLRRDPSAGAKRKTVSDRAEGMAGSFVRGFNNSALAGFANNISAAANAVVPLDRLAGRKEDTMWSEGFKKAYRANLERENRQSAADAQEHGPTSTVADIAGIVASPFNKIGAAFKGGNALARIGRVVAPAAAYGAAEGAHGGNAMQRLKRAGIGAAEATGGALIGDRIGAGARKVLAPKFSKAVQSLIDKGVRLTPGDMAGGATKAAEDRARMFPGLRTLINHAHQQSLEDWNRAIYNRVLEPLGIKYQDGPVGHEGVDKVEQALSSAYGKILPKLTFKPGATFIKSVQSLLNEAKELPADAHRQFEAIIANRVAPRFGANGEMDGETFKKAESELTTFARKYRGSADAGQRELGSKISDLVGLMKYDLERSNPVYAPTLKRLNQSWAAFTRLRDAAGRRIKSGGLITPDDLMASVKKGDRSVGKGAFARGAAMMQKDAKEAQQVLTVPSNSRLSDLIEGGAGTGLAVEGAAHAGAIAAAAAAHPILAGAGVAAAGAYTKPGMNALRALATKGSPKTRNALAKLVRQAATRSGMYLGPHAARQLLGSGF